MTMTLRRKGQVSPVQETGVGARTCSPSTWEAAALRTARATLRTPVSEIRNTKDPSKAIVISASLLTHVIAPEKDLLRQALVIKLHAQHGE